MAYIALYRKWRPHTFRDLVGQDHISRTLSQAITSGRIGHAYLFSGPRGTGKTSTAKILAMALNCKEGPTPDPCGKCESCQRIMDGSAMDVFEIDADDLLVCGHDAHFFGGSAAAGEDIGFVDMVVGEELAEFVAGGVVSDDSECDGFCAEGCDVAHDVCRAAGSAFCAFDLQDGDGGLL